jgi:hypothetical protein
VPDAIDGAARPKLIQVTFMHPASIGLVLGIPFVVQTSDHIPNFRAERTCKALAENVARSDHTYDDCLSAEKLAQQQLTPIWSSFSATIRARCSSQTIALGMNSYLDLLDCLQMAHEAGSNADSGAKPTKPAN